MLVLGGAPAPKRHEGRNRLTVRDPRLEVMLAGISIEGDTLEETRRWGNSLLRSRDVWADKNRCGRRYSDREAAQRNGLVRHRENYR
jgi:hypothetical protein